MKTTNKQPKRKSKNLLDYHNRIDAKSLNYDFLDRIRRQGRSIIKILEEKNFSEELKDAIFIIELNKFDDDLPEIVSLLDTFSTAHDSINSKRWQAEEFLKKIDSEDLISKTKNFHRTAWDYDENFTRHSWHPIWGSQPTFFRNTFLLNIDLFYSDKKSNYENIYDTHTFFENHDNYFKNFINVLYGDGEEGEKFTRNKFNTTIEEYKYLKEINEEIKKQLTTDITKEEIIQDNCKQKIEIIFEKYPATIYKATITLLNFSEKNQNT